MIEGDAFWVDGLSGSALSRLEAAFDERRRDILLLLIPVVRMMLTEGVGDYDVAEDGQAVRSKTKTGTHMFTGIRIVHPRILADMPEGKYSFLQQMDAAEAAGRLYALEHDGEWHHISTPADVELSWRSPLQLGGIQADILLVTGFNPDYIAPLFIRSWRLR